MTQSLFRNQAQALLLDPAGIPKHIAIIPDGNRRWAKAHNLLIEKGHKAGIDLIIQIANAAKELNVKMLTFYLFSTENWNRSKTELTALRSLFKRFLREKCAIMRTHGIRLKIIGDQEQLSPKLQEILNEAVHATQQCDQIDLALAVNYGSRDEIRRAVSSLIDDLEAHKIEKKQINETLISSYLDSAGWQEPDLLIRAGGEKRISNFLLWQMAYTEIYFCERLWPDFTPDDLLDAVIDFQKRKRRWGGT
jgi:undecaprenyl diphosphate synthase